MLRLPPNALAAASNWSTLERCVSVSRRSTWGGCQLRRLPSADLLTPKACIAMGIHKGRRLTVREWNVAPQRSASASPPEYAKPPWAGREGLLGIHARGRVYREDGDLQGQAPRPL